MHITDEMEDPAQRYSLGVLRGGTPQDIEVRLIGLHDVLWRWVNRLHGCGLSLGFVGEVNIMPCTVMERCVTTNVVRPTGGQHEEIEILLLRGEVELRKSWRPFRRKMRVSLKQCNYARHGLRARLLELRIRNRTR